MIDVLIPVLGRPANVGWLLESLAVTVTPYSAIFLCSPGDDAQIAACEASGVRTEVMAWPANRADFALKINWAFEHTEAEWLFQAADDVVFKTGWDTEALRVAKQTGKRVIGTYDLHNPNSRRKISSTHTLFARSYIEEHGGTTDNTGRVFCELYDHQFVDCEFCEVARRRGEWAFSKGSIVEHLHPHWGLAEEDDTYRKAMRKTASDFKLYNRRMGFRNGMTRQDRWAEARALRKAQLG